MKSPRKPVSKKLRFEIFARDEFTCQYCGKRPPDVELHCDHIIPVAESGTNDPENLRTSCAICNLGKGVKVLGDKAPNELDALRRAQEAMEASRFAEEFAAARKKRQELRQDVCNHLCEIAATEAVQNRNITGVMKAIEEFDSERVIGWLEQAALTVGPKETQIMKYFYGILRHVRECGEVEE